MAMESVSSCVPMKMLTAFVELERAIHEFAVTLSQESKSVFNDRTIGFARGEAHRI